MWILNRGYDANILAPSKIRSCLNNPRYICGQGEIKTFHGKEEVKKVVANGVSLWTLANLIMNSRITTWSKFAINLVACSRRLQKSRDTFFVHLLDYFSYTPRYVFVTFAKGQ